MDIKYQVSNLELSKKLKELGAEQKSLFYWQIIPHKKEDGTFDYKISKNSKNRYPSKRDSVCSAFTSAELGEMLPVDIGLPTKLPPSENHPTAGYDWHGITRNVDFLGKTEADARAKMLIYLLENKINY